MLIVPAGIVLVRRMIPAAVMAEHREAAALRFVSSRPRSLVGAAVVVSIWLLGLVLAGLFVARLF